MIIYTITMRNFFTGRVVFLLISLYALIMVGTVVFAQLEDWTYAESFYFSVVTVTTVGYGDLHPTTDTSRLFTAFYVLIGVAIAISALGAIGGQYLESRGILGRYLHPHDKTKDEDSEDS